MKRSDCFEMKSEKRKTKALSHILVCTLLVALLSACVKHEELSFSGTMIGVRNCDLTYTDMNAGYLVQLESPEGVGKQLTTSSGEVLQNIVVLYEAPRVIQAPQHIHGKFYLDDKYARVTGCVQWDNEELNNLPQGVFTEMVVD